MIGSSNTCVSSSHEKFQFTLRAFEFNKYITQRNVSLFFQLVHATMLNVFSISYLLRTLTEDTYRVPRPTTTFELLQLRDARTLQYVIAYIKHTDRQTVSQY